jgi:hypothetical protein
MMSVFASKRSFAVGRFDVIAAALAALLAFQAIGTAHAETQTRSVDPFHAISFEGSWTVDVTVGKERSLVLEGDEDTLAKVKTEVVDGKLKISLKHSFMSWFSHIGHLTAHVTTPNLDDFERFGSGDATLAGLKEDKLDVESDGSGSIKADGHAGNLKLTINGSGTCDFGDVTSDDTKVTINGSGKMIVQPHGNLVAEINGSGDILYVGEPAHITKVVNGSGTIAQK